MFVRPNARHPSGHRYVRLEARCYVMELTPAADVAELSMHAVTLCNVLLRI